MAISFDTLITASGDYDTTNGEVFPLAASGESFMGVQGAELTRIVGDGFSRVMYWNPTDADPLLCADNAFSRCEGIAGGAIYLSGGAQPVDTR